MAHVIGQRVLRNDNAEIMRRVEAGESFTVTRNGRPIADLIPHQADRAPRSGTLGELQAGFRRMTPVDGQRWHRERAEADAFFGSDDPLEDPWIRRRPDAAR
ncbi:MAG TPA: type II toxin-antitoxin system prevent-host-death family antitoxin [Pseudonocardiaceae bacterium]